MNFAWIITNLAGPRYPNEAPIADIPVENGFYAILDKLSSTGNPA